MNIPEAISKFLSTKDGAKALGLSRSSDNMLVRRHSDLSSQGARFVHLLRAVTDGQNQGISY